MNRMTRFAGPLTAVVLVLLGLGILLNPRPDTELENLRTGLEDHQAQMESLANELRQVALCLAPDATDSRCAGPNAAMERQPEQETDQ